MALAGKVPPPGALTGFKDVGRVMAPIAHACGAVAPKSAEMGDAGDQPDAKCGERHG